MGTWTATPRTWVAGEVPTAANFNTDVRDFGRAFADAWTSYTPTLTASTTNPTNWTQTGYYMQAGRFVTCRVRLFAGASMTPGTGVYRIALPVTANLNVPRGPAAIELYDSSSGLVSLVAQIVLDSTYFRLRYQSAFPTGALTEVTHSAPWGWAANDEIFVAFSYEAS